MPVYEYECPSCKHQFEAKRKADEPNAWCPKCYNRDTKRLVSSTAFTLKGEGWAKDNYK